MRAKVITLRFSPQLGRFDDAPLIALQQNVVLEQMREHLVQVGGETMLLCVATWREKAEACGSPATTSVSPTPSAVLPVGSGKSGVGRSGKSGALRRVAS